MPDRACLRCAAPRTTSRYPLTRLLPQRVTHTATTGEPQLMPATHPTRCPTTKSSHSSLRATDRVAIRRQPHARQRRALLHTRGGEAYSRTQARRTCISAKLFGSALRAATTALGRPLPSRPAAPPTTRRRTYLRMSAVYATIGISDALGASLAVGNGTRNSVRASFSPVPLTASTGRSRKSLPVERGGIPSTWDRTRVHASRGHTRRATGRGGVRSSLLDEAAPGPRARSGAHAPPFSRRPLRGRR